MGARGPRPTPSEVLRLRGSWRADLNRGEPKPPLGPPERPDWLDEEAAAVWDQLVPQLEAMGVLTRIDGMALARYCLIWKFWRRAALFVDKYGTSYSIKDGNGRVKAFGQFPEVAQIHKLSLALSRLEQEFGLTPSARTRINVPLQPKESDPVKAKYFMGG